MFKALLMTRLLSLRESLFGRAKKKAGSSKVKVILYTILIVYAVAAVFFSVGMMFFLIAKPLITLNLGWLVMGVAALMSIALSFIGSIFTTEQQLFEAKDNELLMSMPIPPSYILASRMILILFTNMCFALIILLPAFIVYCVFIPKLTVSMVIIFIIAFFLISFFSTALSSACGWIVALVTSRLRKKNLFSTVLILLLLLGYMYFSFNLNNYATKLIANGAAFSDALSKAFPPVFFFGTSINSSDFLSLIWFALWCLIPFAIVYTLLSISLIRIITTKRGEIRVKYKLKELKTSSIRMALMKKELERFFSLPMYILNCSLGSVMGLIFAGALLVKKDVIINAFSMSPQLLEAKAALLLCAVLCFIVSMNDITAPSISLEAKTLWILRSMPIKAFDVFFGKTVASLVITYPPIFISALILCIAMRIPILTSVLFIITPLVLQVFISLFGLALNLKLPRFEWISEIVAIKQSASVVIAIFGGMAAVAVPCLVYVFLASSLSAGLYLFLCIVFYAFLAFLMFTFLKKQGTAIFNTF